MVQIDDKDYENLKKHVVEYMDQVYPDKNITFKVDARRGDKQYPVSSEQINRDMGEAILDAFPEMKVDVHHPDVLLRVEIRQKVNLFSLMIRDRVVCLSVPMVRQCCCFPVVLTARLQVI